MLITSGSKRVKGKGNEGHGGLDMEGWTWRQLD